MKNIKNLKIVGLGLCLNASLLTGCNSLPFGTGMGIIYYESGEIEGKLSYQDVDNHVKIVTFEENDAEITRLVYVNNYKYTNISLSYYDLESGTLLKTNSNVNDYSKTGENLNIIDTKEFIPYLFVDENIKDKYDVSELIDVYKENYVNKEKVLDK